MTVERKPEPRLTRGEVSDHDLYPVQRARTKSRARTWIVRVRDYRDFVYEAVGFVARLPHFKVFERYTRHPILAIINAKDDGKEEKIRAWIRLKKQEAQYVQVAVSCDHAHTLRNLTRVLLGCCHICVSHWLPFMD